MRRPCYIGLYEQILAERREINPRLQEIILDSFMLSNGVFKRTNHARFDDFDCAVLGIIHESRVLHSGGTVHDLAGPPLLAPHGGTKRAKPSHNQSVAFKS